MSEVLEKVTLGMKEVGEKFRYVADYMLEKMPDVVRSIAMASTVLIVASSAVAIAMYTVGSIHLFSAVIVPMVLLLVQIFVSISIVALIIGVARRLK